MKILIVGLGSSGKASAALLLAQGHNVIGVDKSPELLAEVDGFPVFLESEPLDFSSIGQVIVSPGIPPSHSHYQQAVDQGIEVIGEAELAFRHLDQPCIAITGTNGKTTVTLLVTHILEHAGFKARALGNIGTPLASYCLAPNKEEVLVVELSSFQLETMQMQAFDAGVILNITPDHLDWHTSMKHYAAAKCHLQKCLKKGAPLFVYDDVISEYGSFLDKDKIERYTHLENIETILPLSYRQGCRHDRDNALAAWALVQRFGVSKAQFLAALESFKKPPHRIEFVTQIEGVSFYDDSKGTNIDAVLRAVDAMPGNVVLIAGGVDKGASYAPWLSFAKKVRKIFVIGEAAHKMIGELQKDFSVERCASLEDAVFRAAAHSEKGECVLLSPGCASFDMFRSYAHRGEEFKRHVYDLQERRKKG